ncbi:hypothetical protein CR203_01235 [Salipaludibacillus neizhouensis]|uniref:Nucleotidase n=1 Tax=Salipaludibacillus neizhouensis TaxID=885475 RepID=A0A3A9KLJ5_9BACI|nr:hypothetical protein [Salipaludibacillus neizhouensis]RKL68705.1 hypothetical protein CR203_01235 [Salipaludibacillus neizhouensis]
MGKYRFGIDIDGTITNPDTFLPYLNKHFEKQLTLDDIVEYELSGVLGLTKQQFLDWMKVHEPNIYKQAEMAEHAKDTLLDWKKYHELYFISARPKEVKTVTEEWFHRLTVPYDHIELLGQHDKLNAVKKHNVDIFFEDKHDNACNIAEECHIPVILMNTPYNQLPVPSNVFRVADWKEAKQKVSTIF